MKNSHFDKIIKRINAKVKKNRIKFIAEIKNDIILRYKNILQ